MRRPYSDICDFRQIVVNCLGFIPYKFVSVRSTIDWLIKQPFIRQVSSGPPAAAGVGYCFSENET